MIVVAANPYGGAARPRARVEALLAALAEAGRAARVVWDAGERAALLGDPGAMADVRCVVAAGGDGTVAAVINELHDDVPLAVLPTGNENLFARALGFDVEPARLTRAILRGARRRLDLGQARTAAGTRRFGLMLSAGFDAEVIHRVAHGRARRGTPPRVGRAGYLLPIGATLWAYEHTLVSVTVENVTVPGAYCMIANLPDYPLSLSSAPGARADDGLLDWVAFERPGLGALAAYAWAVLRARHRALPQVHGGRARRLRLSSTRPVPVQLDGEPAGCTPVDVEVLPAALAVVVV